ncbi:MAG: hypothetical protein JWM57_4249 [Phycisphaerales bacterium]|nr:hypothetical protein [Phycisphaerales bacterium]
MASDSDSLQQSPAGAAAALPLMPNPVRIEKNRPALPMWARLILIVLSVGGGVSGVTSVVVTLFGPAATGWANVAICLGFIGLYTFVVVAGLILVVDPSRTKPMMFALVPQLAFWSSSSVSFMFACGPWALVSVSAIRFYFGFEIGSQWSFRINQPVQGQIGVNVLAVWVLMFLVIHRVIGSSRHANTGH